ncbi:VWD domain-containing protein [Larkinella punicea]|uniref:VWFD domain-containing protein n=1 Tax=Larkinella punicea TaxID=2315727 RepID=A0A368JS63_9BACT|nr:VWD domain-containing protein [Larkinella punicea]RCR69021.1 hypothetical protein DUE52_14140 [Larkinella punicea]
MMGLTFQKKTGQMGLRHGLGAAVLFLLLLPQSCKQKDSDPALTSDGPKGIRYHQLIIECTEATTQNKGVAILDFRFDVYANQEVAGYMSAQYLAYKTTRFTAIDAAIQTANADIAAKAAEVKSFSTMTDFIVSRLTKVADYSTTKSNLSENTIWGILANEETVLADLHRKSSLFDLEEFLVALLATPARAQTLGRNQGVNYHSGYFYSPPPQPGSSLPEYRFVNPVPQAKMPSDATPVQRNSRGETPAEQAAREEAARAAAQAGRTNRGPRSVSDAFNGIFDRLGDALGNAAAAAGRAMGDPHVITHDGLDYGFQAVGEFVATKGEKIEIQARQEDAYKTNRATVTTGVAARIGTDEICFLVNPASLDAPRLFVNKKETALSSFTPLTLANGNQLRVAAKEKLVFTNAEGEGVTIRWNTPYLDYAVMLGDARKGNVTGLMGNFDGDDQNDFKLANGTAIERSFPTIHTTFADSWRISGPNSLFVYENGKNTDSYTDRAFPKTFPVIDPEKYKWAEGVCQAAGVNRQPELGHCIFDVAVTGDERLARSAVLGQQEFPASPDVRVFTNLKLDLKEGQSNDPQTRNLLDLDNGTFYRFADGAKVAYEVDVVFDYYSGPWFAGPRAVQNCGVSCGAYTIWPLIDQQKWPFFANTFLRYTTIPANQWETFSDAAALRKAWTFDAGADEKTELVKGLTDLSTSAPLTPYLWSFRTQQGKKGLIRFTQGQVNKAGGSSSFTFDVKIER